MGLYHYYQPNTKDIKDKQGDCAIRALTKFLNISWVEAFDMLVKYARETQTMINSMDNIKLCLENQNIPYTSIYKPKEKKTAVADFAKSRKIGTYILYVKSGFKTHLVCCDQGKYYDTWDCGRCIVYGFFKK